MTPSVIERLEREVLLLDGGIGSRLIARGLASGRAPEWWNLERPEEISAVHRSYVDAGSDIIQTNTFGASPIKLGTVGLTDRCAEVNRRGVEIAREAAGSRTLVAGDLGPTGEMFPPMGAATAGGLRAAFVEQARALADAGADLITIETMYDLREAMAALEAALETGLPVFASMTFERKPRGCFTIVGDRLGQALEALTEAGAAAVGLNCGVGTAAMLEMVREAAAANTAPLVIQPNAGEPRVTTDGVVYDSEPGPFARDLEQMIEAGARVVGGCCGTDAGHIQAMREVIDAAAKA